MEVSMDDLSVAARQHHDNELGKVDASTHGQRGMLRMASAGPSSNIAP